MALIEQLTTSKKIPFAPTYRNDLKEIEFLRVSYKGKGSEYTMGEAPDGRIIHKMDCEERDEYKQRCLKTPGRSYVSSILNKYNSAVFKNEPSRSTVAPTYELMFNDADGYGTPLNEVMRKALLQAQIDGSCYLLADSTASDTAILTVAQKLASDARPYVRIVEVPSVVNIHEIENNILEAIVMLVDEVGTAFARYMNNEVFIDIKLIKDTITEVSEPYVHGYSSIPLVRIKPLQDAQALPIANSQRSIVNILSLLQQELNDSVFTKWILSGTRVSREDAGDQQKITWSGKRLVVIEDANAKISQLGADHGCADSLRKEIEIEEASMYYSAGFGKANVEPTNLSGLSRLLSLEDFFINARALKRSIEMAENQILTLIASKEGFEYVETVYSDKFISDDSGESLQVLRDQLVLNFPNAFKKMLIRDYISRFYNVTEKDMAEIEQELVEGTDG